MCHNGKLFKTKFKQTTHRALEFKSWSKKEILHQFSTKVGFHLDDMYKSIQSAGYNGAHTLYITILVSRKYKKTDISNVD